MKEYRGITASEGMAYGPLAHLPRPVPGLIRRVQDPFRERALFDAAVVLAKDELKQLEQKAEGDDKDIFLFQRVLLEDESLLNEVGDYITAGAGSAAAVEHAAQVFAARIGDLDDAYIRERSADVMDACQRVVDILDGRPHQKLQLTEPAILVSEYFYPSDVVGLGRGLVKGLISTAGSSQSHAAIIARTMNIPAMIQVDKDIAQEKDGTMVLIDTGGGVVISEPDEQALNEARKRLRAQQRRLKSQKNLLVNPCPTRDGAEVRLMANCSGPEDIEQAVAYGALGIGLVRTEFLLMSTHLPSEEEQYYFYLSCVSAAEGKKVFFRTFDIGADKAVIGLSRQEANPALGLRGIRATLARPSLMEDQLCALLRVAAKADVKISFPMVGSVQQWDLCVQAVEKAKDKLKRRGVQYQADPELGCMIEVPNAALEAEELIAHGCRYFSIGTNDLTQYTCAADRMDARLSEYYNPANLGVLRLMQMVVDVGARHNIPVSVCGLAAADPDMVEIYARMGIRCLSMACQSFAKVSQRISQLDLSAEASAARTAKPRKAAEKSMERTDKQTERSMSKEEPQAEKSMEKTARQTEKSMEKAAEKSAVPEKAAAPAAQTAEKNAAPRPSKGSGRSGNA